MPHRMSTLPRYSVLSLAIVALYRPVRLALMQYSRSQGVRLWPVKPSVSSPWAQAAEAISSRVFLPSHSVEWQCTLAFR